MTPLALLAAHALAVPVELHHTGRLLDPNGVPLEGSRTVTITLHPTADTVGDAFHTTTLTDPLEGGYYSVVLALDSSQLVADVWVQANLDGSPLGPRQKLVSVPRAAVAYEVDGGPVRTSGVTIQGTGHVVLGQDGTSSCGSDGALAFDPTTDAVRVCVANKWRTLATEIETTTVNGAFEWENGQKAASCDAYRHPDPGFTAATTDGVYRIDSPLGEMTVLCDMTRDGGGWTLVYASADLAHLSGHYNDHWYTTAYRGPTLSVEPTALVETNGLLQQNSYWLDVRFTVDVDANYAYVLDRGVWNGGTAEVNDPRFVRFNTGHAGQFWNGVATCSSGCHAALAVPIDGADTNNGYYRVWGHTNGPPNYGLDSEHGLDIWVR